MHLKPVVSTCVRYSNGWKIGQVWEMSDVIGAAAAANLTVVVKGDRGRTDRALLKGGPPSLVNFVTALAYQLSLLPGFACSIHATWGTIF